MRLLLFAEVGFAEAEYTSRLASLRDEVTALNPAYFEAVKKEHEEAQVIPSVFSKTILSGCCCLLREKGLACKTLSRGSEFRVG